ncbi:MAG: ribosome biogenesis GTPase YlqF [Spirochaetia bacterium]
MAIQWFPGHMNKARKLLAEYVDNIDGVLEIVDSRAPNSSRNPLIDEIFAKKPRLILLNKSDLCDLKIMKKWQDFYEGQGLKTLAISVKNRHNLERLKGEAAGLAKAGKTRTKPPRLMIVGIPNCGKSSLINALGREKKARVADSPGITRDVALYKLGNLDLIDSPGTLWPNLSDQNAAARLAALGSIKDEVYLATEALGMVYPYLHMQYRARLKERYRIDPGEELDHFLSGVAARFNKKIEDTEALAMMVFRDLRAGKLGAICLEDPDLWQAQIAQENDLQKIE